MAFLELDTKETTAVIRMNYGKNTQKVVFARTLNSLLEEVDADTSVTSLVITSTDEKNWSQGIDLEWMNQEIAGNNVDNVREFFVQLDQVYSKLMLMPLPTIAAITGHAFGAGAFLATACDYRFMNGHRGFFCFTANDLKMDFLPGVFSMMLHKLPDFKLPDLVYSGKRVAAAELEKHFIVEKACASIEDTIQTALDFALNLNKDRDIFGIYKQKFNGNAAKTLVEKDLEHFEKVYKQ